MPRGCSWCRRATAPFDDRGVRDLPDLLRPGDALVFNDTRVIPAALEGVRRRGDLAANVAVTLIERVDDNRWRAFARPAKRLQAGDRLHFGHDGSVCLLGALDATVAESGEAGEVELAFDLSGPDLDEAIAAVGEMPLPPYIAGKRAVGGRRPRRLPDDLRRARRRRRRADGRAALHAGADGGAGRARHLAPLRDAARRRRHLPAGEGRRHAPITRCMPSAGEVSAETAAALNAVRAARRAHRRRRHDVAAAAGDRGARRARSRPSAGATDIFITPGYRFRAVDLLMTNFHLPRSTLFMLVAAFAGLETHAGGLCARDRARLPLLLLRRRLPALSVGRHVRKRR